MGPAKEEMSAMVDEYELCLKKGLSRVDALLVAGLTEKRLQTYRAKLGRNTRISGMGDRYKGIYAHVEKRMVESPLKTLDDILKEIGTQKTTYSKVCKTLGLPPVKRPQWALSKMLGRGGKKSAPPLDHYRDIVHSVDAIVEEDGLTTKDACKIVGLHYDTYRRARKKLGLEPAGVRSWKDAERLTYGPGNGFAPGYLGLLRMETVIGLESRNISNEFKGKATETEMREILRQRIRNMTDGKVTVRF
jgi:hypothetical protein